MSNVQYFLVTETCAKNVTFFGERAQEVCIKAIPIGSVMGLIGFTGLVIAFIILCLAIYRGVKSERKD